MAWLASALLAALAAGCAVPPPSPTIQAPSAIPTSVRPTVTPSAPAATPTEHVTVLTVVSHDSFEVSAELVAAFEAEHAIEVALVKAGTTEQALAFIIDSAEAASADILLGLDGLSLDAALDHDLFLEAELASLARVPEAFLVDPDSGLVPYGYSDLCLSYDASYFDRAAAPPPTGLSALTEPAQRGLFVMPDPATSREGLAFLASTVSVLGQDEYLQFWQDLATNDVLVVADWPTAYFEAYTLYGGTRPILLSYTTVPAGESYFGDPSLAEPPSRILAADGSCYRLVEYGGVLTSTVNPGLARAWIEYMLTPAVQADLATSMLLLPVNPAAQLPEDFTAALTIPATYISLDPTIISQNRERWIEEWSALMDG